SNCRDGTLTRLINTVTGCTEDRLNDQLCRHLHHSVSYRRYPKRPLLLAVRLQDVSAPHRLRPIFACLERLLNAPQELLDAARLDIGERLLIDARRTSVGLHPLPRFPQDVTPVDPVIQRVKAPCLAPLGTSPEPALQFSHFVFRVVRPHGHALVLTCASGATKAGLLPSSGLSPPSS